MIVASDKSLELTIPADTRYVSVVRRGVRNLAQSAGFGNEQVADVEVAVSEAVTNSVVHGSPDPDSSAVVVRCHTTGNYLVIEIEDHSPADSLPGKPSECEETAECGRGVLMMYALMDECSNSRTEHGIRVRMAKLRAAN